MKEVLKPSSTGSQAALHTGSPGGLLMPGFHPRDSDVIGPEHGLGFKNFKTPPGDFHVLLGLRTAGQFQPLFAQMRTEAQD